MPTQQAAVGLSQAKPAEAAKPVAITPPPAPKISDASKTSPDATPAKPAEDAKPAPPHVSPSAKTVMDLRPAPPTTWKPMLSSPKIIEDPIQSTTPPLKKADVVPADANDKSASVKSQPNRRETWLEYSARSTIYK